MAAKSLRDRPHLFLPGGGVVEPYRRPNQKIKPPALPPDGQANDPDLRRHHRRGDCASRDSSATPSASVCLLGNQRGGCAGSAFLLVRRSRSVVLRRTGPKLIILSAGILRSELTPDGFLDLNDLESLEDPGQAWNAFPVGAFTEKVDIFDREISGWLPLAPAAKLHTVTRLARTIALGRGYDNDLSSAHSQRSSLSTGPTGKPNFSVSAAVARLYSTGIL